MDLVRGRALRLWWAALRPSHSPQEPNRAENIRTTINSLTLGRRLGVAVGAGLLSVGSVLGIAQLASSSAPEHSAAIQHPIDSDTVAQKQTYSRWSPPPPSGSIAPAPRDSHRTAPSEKTIGWALVAGFTVSGLSTLAIDGRIKRKWAHNIAKRRITHRQEAA